MNSSVSEEHADYEWAVQLNRYSLNVIGLWPANCHGRKMFLTELRAVVTFVLMTVSCTVPCLCSLIMQYDNLLLFIDTLGYATPLVISQMKFLIIYKNKKVLLPIINMMAEDWAKSKTITERNVMVRQARIGRAFGILCCILLLVLTTLLFVLPRFGIKPRYVPNDTDVRQTFMVPSYYFYDAHQTPYFEILLGMQLIAILAVITCYTGIDNFLGTLIFHICGQLKNLRNRIASLKQSENFDRILIATVNDHIRLIRATNTIENTFTLLLLLMLLYFGIFACIYGLLLFSILADESKWRIFFTLGVLLNTFLSTSFYCAAGQTLVSQSEGVYNAAYECEWLNLNSKEAKNLILIMARAKKPLYITAGKLFPMTMLTFCNILKVSFSYISFLLTKV